MTEPLEVQLHGRPIGVVEPTRNGGRFAYSAEAAGSLPGLPLLSTSLPVTHDPYDPDATRTWFVGLLPEEARLDEVRRRFGLQTGNYLDLLREVGWECAGAVQLAPVGADERPGSLQLLTDNELAERLAALPSHPFDGDAALRISLGGLQAKMLVTETPGGWALPLDGAISTHILKPQPSTRFPGMVAAEAWAMTAAKRATDVADVSLIHLDGAPETLVVRRFDRRVRGGHPERIHQEDAAQAMGVPVEHKYAASTANAADPTFERIAGILTTYAVDPERELERLLEQVTVNVVVGNTDAHAKNYGILHPAEQIVELSPMYDVVPAAAINPAERQMGMRVGGVLRLDRVDPSHVIDEGRAWGVRERRARDIVERTAVRVAAALDDASALVPHVSPAVVEDVEARVQGFLNQLAR